MRLEYKSKINLKVIDNTKTETITTTKLTTK